MIPVLNECCYTCKNSLVIKHICKLKNMPILNIYKDKCDLYSPRKMYKCKLCNNYVISLKNHLSQYHNKTTTEYIILTRNIVNTSSFIRSDTVWNKKKT